MRTVVAIALSAAAIACHEGSIGGRGVDGGRGGGDGGKLDGGGSTDAQGSDGGIITTSTACAVSFVRASPGAQLTETGPSGGNVTAVLSLGAGVILVGTGPSASAAGHPGRSSAIYRSTDHGLSFAKIIAFSSGDSGVKGFALLPQNGVYAAVGSISGSSDDGVYRSMDGGRSFAPGSAGLFAGARPLAISATSGSPERAFLLVGGTPQDPLSFEQVIYREDSGGSWTLAPAMGIDPSLGGPSAIAVDPMNPDQIYAADDARFYASNDGASSFVATPFGATFGATAMRSVRGLFADPQTSGRILLTTDQELFESMDSGGSWAAVASVPAQGVRGVAFMGASTLALTDASGLFVSSGAEYTPTGACLFAPSLRAIAARSDDPSAIYVGASGPGLYRSLDGGRRFDPQSSGIDEVLGRVVVTGTGTGATAWILSGAGLYRLERDRRTWTRIADGAGTMAFSDLASDPRDPDGVLLATDGDLFDSGGPGIGVVRLSLSRGTLAPASGIAGKNVARVSFDPMRGGRAYAYALRGVDEDPAVTPIGVYASADGGRSFAMTNLKSYDPAPFYPFTFPSSPLALSAAGAIYAGALSHTSTSMDGPIIPELWRSTDGQTFQRVWSGDGSPDEIANGVYVGKTGAVFIAGRTQGSPLLESASGGSFVPFDSGVLAQTYSVIDLAAAPDGTVYAVGGSTVAYAPSAGSFSMLGGGLTALDVAVGVAYLPATSNSAAVVLVATLTRGIVWRSAP
jgi:hypothetical protein